MAAEVEQGAAHLPFRDRALLKGDGHVPALGLGGLGVDIDLTAAQPATLRRRAVAVAAGACAVLVLVAVALPIASQARALARVEARIERLRPAIAEVDGLRRRLAATTAGSDALAAEETRLGCVLCTIALLTDLLPDDTFLTAMSIRQRQVTLSGQSGDAARLIPLLSGEGALGEVAFLAPVTRTGPNRAEQFSLPVTRLTREAEGVSL